MPPRMRNTSGGWSACCAMPLRASFQIVLGADPIHGKYGAGVVIFPRARGLSKMGGRRNAPHPAAPVPVNSTLLASVTYDAGQSILQLEFCDGAIYRYFAVPPLSTTVCSPPIQKDP